MHTHLNEIEKMINNRNEEQRRLSFMANKSKKKSANNAKAKREKYN